MCSILRCSMQLALKLKEINFQKQSLYLSNLFYVIDDVVFNKKSYKAGSYIYSDDIDMNVDIKKIAFMPYYAEVYDWLSTEYNLSVPIWNDGHGYKFSIFDNYDIESKSLLDEEDTLCYNFTEDSIENPITINELAIDTAIDYLISKKAINIKP